MIRPAALPAALPLALAAALAAGCRAAGAAPDAPSAGAELPDPAALLAADRAFAQAADRDGLEGWLAAFHPEAVRLMPGADPVVGLEAIRRFDAALFADPDRRLVWEPTDGHVFADGRTGFTRGRYEVLALGAVAQRGSYLTFWQRVPDGSGGERWAVIFDTGSPDP